MNNKKEISNVDAPPRANSSARDKQYGKPTEDQIRWAIKTLPEYRKDASELQALIKTARPEKLREVLGDGIWWAPLYELPLAEILALMILAVGDTERVKEWAKSPEPVENLIDHLNSWTVGDWDDGPGKRISPPEFIAIVTAIQRNVHSIMIYKKSLCTLVKEAKNGNTKSLFDAVRVDRTAISCPSIAARISQAELTGDKRFFLRLISALKGPSKKYWEGQQDLRYALVLLREFGLNNLSDDELHQLLVKDLKVYKDSPTAKKNLRKQYYESLKIKDL